MTTLSNDKLSNIVGGKRDFEIRDKNDLEAAQRAGATNCEPFWKVGDRLAAQKNQLPWWNVSARAALVWKQFSYLPPHRGMQCD